MHTTTRMHIIILWILLCILRSQTSMHIMHTQVSISQLCTVHLSLQQLASWQYYVREQIYYQRLLLLEQVSIILCILQSMNNYVHTTVCIPTLVCIQSIVLVVKSTYELLQVLDVRSYYSSSQQYAMYFTSSYNILLLATRSSILILLSNELVVRSSK